MREEKSRTGKELDVFLIKVAYRRQFKRCAPDLSGGHTLLVSSLAKCSELYKVPVDLRCQWVRQNEFCFEGTTIIQYVPFLICNFTTQTLFIGIILLLLLLTFLFIILGTVADEFFCPNLEVIAKSLNLAEATAGVTILAFGNGSPDIFTSLAGVPRGHIELIFCELIGGGIFITTVLVGTICLFHPINVVGRILIRDVCFYLVSIGWTYYSFSKQYLTIFDTGGYIFIYGVYLLAVITDIRFRRSIVSRASQLIPESDFERLRMLHSRRESDAGSKQDISRSASISQRLSASESEQLRMLLACKRTLENEENLKESPSNSSNSGNPKRDVPKPQGTSREEQKKPTEGESKENLTVKRSKSASFDESNKDVEKNKWKLKNCPFFKSVCFKDPIEDETTEPLLGEPKPPSKSLWSGFKEEINPISMEDWKSSSCFFKIFLAIKSPIVLFLKLTVPVVTIHKPMRGWCKLLSILLCITFPLYTVSASGFAGVHLTQHKIPLIIFFLAGGKLCSLLVLCTSYKDKEPPYHIAFAFLGFIGSIFTVFTAASEVVNLMWAIGVVGGISEATLGLTVLSWGTQIGDFISILALVRAGYERMGFVACYGGSLFNVIMSIGLAFTVATVSSENRRFAVAYGKMGLVCLAFLALSLLSSFVAFPLMRFRTRSFFGLYLYLLYATFIAVCLLNEFNVIKLPETAEEKSTLSTELTTTAEESFTEFIVTDEIEWDR